MSRKRSAIWTHFEVIDKVKAKCLSCKRIMKSYGSTGNLFDHLRRKHPSILPNSSGIGADIDINSTTQEERESESESAMELGNDVETNTGAHFFMKRATFETGGKSTDSQYSKTAVELLEGNSCIESDAEKCNPTYNLSYLLVDMIAESFFPTSMIQGEGFRHLIHTLNPSHILPSRKEFLAQHLPARYEMARLQVKNLIDQTDYVSLVPVIWKLNNRCFVSCIAYFILNSDLHHFLLATERIPFSYTRKSIVSALSTIAVDWDIDNKISCVVVEDNERMLSAIEDLDLPYLPCIHYNVNQIMAKVLKDPTLSQVRHLCKEIAKYFEKNAAASNKLIEIQLMMNKPKLKLMIEKRLKWSSTVAMFKRILEMRDEVSSAISKLNDSPESLTEPEWDVITDCVLLLDPLVNLTEGLLSEKYQLASQIIPLVHSAQELIVSSCPKSKIGSKLKSILIGGCNEKLSVYNELKVATHSTLLDPRLKEYGFRDETCIENACTLFIKDLTELHNKSLNEVQEPSTDDSSDDKSFLCSSLDKNVSQSYSTSEMKAHQDFKHYSSMALMSRKNGNPFLFWEKLRNSFPNLAHLGLKYLCIPAHILNSKTMFSKFQMAKMLKASNLKAKKNIDKILFLHVFCKLRDDYNFN